MMEAHLLSQCSKEEATALLKLLRPRTATVSYFYPFFANAFHYGMHVRFWLDYVFMVFAYFINRENLPEQAQLVCGKLVIY